MLVYFWRRGTVLARKRRIERRKVASKKRWANYLSVRRQTSKLALTKIFGALYHPLPVERTLWCKARSSNWWDAIVTLSFKDKDWLRNFRMKKATFDFICNELEPYLYREGTVMRKPIPVPKRIAVALWRFATGSYYNTIAHLFGISECSVCTICEEVAGLIVENLMPRFIRFPVGADLDKVVADFEERWGFPQCAGAIDGSHIPIKAPREYHADYYNRKGWYSVILQGLVDSKYRFTEINVGWPGKVHDSRVFSNSSMYEKGMSGRLFSAHNSKYIHGVKVPVVIIADAAYPLLSWVMKPFPDNGKLSVEKLQFNYRLSRARMVVENAFGRLKGRWRCLLKQNEADHSKINDVVAACCTLHNICEAFDDAFNNELMANVNESADSSVFDQEYTANENVDNGQAIRNALVRYFQTIDIESVQ